MKPHQISVFRRYVFFCVGLFVMAFGIAFSIKADLGTSPISSLPYVISLFTPLTVGNVTIIMHCVLIVIQIAILRKRYNKIQLIQLPVAIVFGYLTDFAIWATDAISPQTYWQQWLVCCIGIVTVAFGVSMEINSHATTLAGEGVVLAVCKVTKIKVGNMKIIFDVTLVCTAIVLSFIFLHKLAGVREGTVAAAILVGTVTKQFNRLFGPFYKKRLTAKGDTVTD